VLGDGGSDNDNSSVKRGDVDMGDNGIIGDIEEQGERCGGISIHHITAGVELEDHQLAHILATSTRVKAGSAPVISANFARCGAVT
jgi:hypothetical protein